MLMVTALAVALLGGCPGSNGNDEIRVTVDDEGGGGAVRARTASEVVALARAEGEVTWFTSIAEKQANQFARAFERKYPSLRVRLVRGGTFDLVSRIGKEIDAGTPTADVLHVLDPAIFVALRQRGELMQYVSPEAADVAPEYRDPGYWTAARLVTIGLAYDSRKLSASEVPQHWSALLASRWRGKLGLKDAQSAGSAYAQYYFLREKYGRDFWEQMANQRPRIYKTEDDLLNAVASGEIQIAAGVMGSNVQDFDHSHQVPLNTVWPRDGVPLVIGPVAVLSRAPHPNAARLFVDYCLSRDGQAMLRDLLGAYSARAGLQPPTGAPALSSLVLLTAPAGWTEYLAKQDDLRAEYNRLFHGESE